MYKTLQLSGWHLHFGIKTQRPSNVMKGFHDFPHFPHANARTPPQLGYNRMLPYPYSSSFILLIIIQHDVVWDIDRIVKQTTKNHHVCCLIICWDPQCFNTLRFMDINFAQVLYCNHFVNTSTSSLIHVLGIKLICTANIYGKDLVVQCLMLVENNKYLHHIQYIELLKL